MLFGHNYTNSSDSSSTGMDLAAIDDFDPTLAYVGVGLVGGGILISLLLLLALAIKRCSKPRIDFYTPAAAPPVALDNTAEEDENHNYLRMPGV